MNIESHSNILKIKIICRSKKTHKKTNKQTKKLKTFKNQHAEFISRLITKIIEIGYIYTCMYVNMYIKNIFLKLRIEMLTIVIVCKSVVCLNSDVSRPNCIFRIIII